MAVTEDIKRLVTILIEEGFGALAGELLTEISLGREVETRIDGETIITRQPIIAQEQLVEAMSILRLRLVEPVRALAEAERIAGELTDQKAVRIRFIEPQERRAIELLSRRDLADRDIGDRLDDLLERLPRMIDPQAPIKA